MTSAMYGVAAYQQASQTWKTAEKKTENPRSAESAEATAGKSAEKSAELSKFQTKTWSPIDTASSLVPTVKEGYGTVIGDVGLSDKAKDYYDQLKSKYHNADFILVSKDMKAQVQQNAAAYGNANKMVVLIDEEKLERMATDDSYRKKYEGLISMGQEQLAMAKTNLASSGASVKNFGMSVDSKGNTSFFATLDESSKAQQKRIEKKAEQKKEQKAQEKKKAAKEAKEERIEKAREKNKAGKTDSADKESEIEDTEAAEEYVMIEADSLEGLVQRVQTYTYDQMSQNLRTESEKALGQNFDFRG